CKLHVRANIKKIPPVAKVEPPAALLAIRWKQDSGFAFAFCREHSEQEPCRQWNVVKFDIKGAGDDLVIRDSFRLRSDNPEMGILQIASRVAVVNTQYLVTLVLKCCLAGQNPITLLCQDLNDSGASRFEIVDDAFGFINLRTILKYRVPDAVSQRVAYALRGDGVIRVIDNDLLRL